jgi:hypothetical protein
MKLTNKYNLPETIVNVIKRPQYSRGKSQISATEILNSPRIVQLRQKHMDDIETDAAEMVWSLFGTAVHNILQHGKDDHHIVEERLHIEFDGWHISGALDLQEVTEAGIGIRDYKVTSAWAVQQYKTEWIEQLNLYAWLVEKVKGIAVTDLKIVGIVRDWSRRDAASKESYPQAPIVTLDFPLWPMEVREKFIKDRLAKHNEAVFALGMGDSLEECTPEEMWERPTVYAVRKIGGVRAKTLFSDKQAAEDNLAELNEKKVLYELDVREGTRTRCEGFCQVAPYCDQYQTYLAWNKRTEIL